MYEQIKVESSVPRRGETILVAEVAYPPFGEGRWGGASLPEGGVSDLCYQDRLPPAGDGRFDFY